MKRAAGDWILGAAAAVAAIGPGLGSGSLLSLDLVLTPTMPVPPGMWGLGPELPRRVPLGAVLGWLSPLVGGATAGKALLVVCIAAGVAGASRLARSWGAESLAAAAAGLVYGLSPFVLTRLGAGQWGVLAATGVLPWVAERLVRPAEHLPRTFLASAALGLTGFVGGTYALVLVLVGLAVSRPRITAGAKAGVAVTVGQLPWLLPGLVVTAVGPALNNAASFPTRVDGVLDALSVVTGHGFWRRSNDVGLAGAAASAAGAALLVAGGAGWSRLPRGIRPAVAVSAGLGLGLALASGTPGLRGVYAGVTSVGAGAALRESHRFLPLLLVWLAPAAALGATRAGERLAARSRPLIPAALAGIAVALALPALWGVDGRLDPAHFPPGYGAARARIARHPGPVLALPWHQYLDLSFAGGRRVLNPLPDYLGGDVLASADPELDGARREDTDGRGARVDRLVRDHGGAPESGDLVALGVRWVVLLEEVEWRDVQRILDADPGLRPAPAGDGLRLYEVEGWRGPAVTLVGERVGVHAVARPWLHMGSDEELIVARSGSAGWLRGTTRTSVTGDGLLHLPPGRGPLWYWPALLVVAGDVTSSLFALVALKSLSGRRT